MIELTVTAVNMEEAAAQISAALKDHITTDDLLTELRKRMTLQHLEVVIRGADRDAAPSDETGTTHAAPPEKRGPGRPRKVQETAEGRATRADAVMEKTQQEAADERQAADEERATKKTNGKEKIVVTREQVIEALEAYAKENGGQAAGREVMKKVTGATRLIDCPIEDYAKLVDALRV